LNQPSPEYTETVEGKTEMNIMSEAATEKAVDAAIEESAIKMRGTDVSVFYGEKQALFRCQSRCPQEQRHRADWALRLRQVDISCAASTG
jgi:hypothetical protein